MNIDPTKYYSKELLDILRKQLDNISPMTWHHIANPFCGQCLYERGKAIIAGQTDCQVLLKQDSELELDSILQRRVNGGLE